MAHFRFKSLHLIKEIPEKTKAITFQVELDSGEGQLDAFLSGQRKDEQEISPFLVDVEFIEK